MLICKFLNLWLHIWHLKSLMILCVFLWGFSSCVNEHSLSQSVHFSMFKLWSLPLYFDSFQTEFLSFSHGHCRRQNQWWRREAGTLSKKSAGAGHRAVSLHRGCVLVFKAFLPLCITLLWIFCCFLGIGHTANKFFTFIPFTVVN